MNTVCKIVGKLYSLVNPEYKLGTLPKRAAAGHLSERGLKGSVTVWDFFLWVLKEEGTDD